MGTKRNQKATQGEKSRPERAKGRPRSPGFSPPENPRSSSQSPLGSVSANRTAKTTSAPLLVLSPRRHKLHILRFRLWRKLIHSAAAPLPTKALLLRGPQRSASLGFCGAPLRGRQSGCSVLFPAEKSTLGRSLRRAMPWCHQVGRLAHPRGRLPGYKIGKTSFDRTEKSV